MRASSENDDEHNADDDARGVLMTLSTIECNFTIRGRAGGEYFELRRSRASHNVTASLNTRDEKCERDS